MLSSRGSTPGDINRALIWLGRNASRGTCFSLLLSFMKHPLPLMFPTAVLPSQRPRFRAANRGTLVGAMNSPLAGLGPQAPCDAIPADCSHFTRFTQSTCELSWLGYSLGSRGVARWHSCSRLSKRDACSREPVMLSGHGPLLAVQVEPL